MMNSALENQQHVIHYDGTTPTIGTVPSVLEQTLKPKRGEIPSHQIAVVLVEPRIPQNTGNIARLCACTQSELYLVGSLGFRLGDKYLERAGMDYLDDIEIKHVPDFADVLQAKPGWTPYFLSTKAKKCYTEIQFPHKSLLVFGSETQGLPKWLIEENPDTSLRIPMAPDTRSLNLSNSVAIVLYEAIRQLSVPK